MDLKIQSEKEEQYVARLQARRSSGRYASGSLSRNESILKSIRVAESSEGQESLEPCKVYGGRIKSIKDKLFAQNLGQEARPKRATPLPRRRFVKRNREKSCCHVSSGAASPSELQALTCCLEIERRRPGEPRDPLFRPSRTSTLVRQSRLPRGSPPHPQRPPAQVEPAEAYPDPASQDDSLSSIHSSPDSVPNALNDEQRRFLNDMLSSTDYDQTTTSTTNPVVPSDDCSSVSVRVGTVSASFTEYFADPTNKKVSEVPYSAENFEAEFTEGNEALRQHGPDKFFNNGKYEREVKIMTSQVVNRNNQLPPDIPEETSSYKSSDDMIDEADKLSGKSLSSEDMIDLDREICSLDEEAKPPVETNISERRRTSEGAQENEKFTERLKNDESLGKTEERAEFPSPMNGPSNPTRLEVESYEQATNDMQSQDTEAQVSQAKFSLKQRLSGLFSNIRRRESSRTCEEPALPVALHSPASSEERRSEQSSSDEIPNNEPLKPKEQQIMFGNRRVSFEVDTFFENNLGQELHAKLMNMRAATSASGSGAIARVRKNYEHNGNNANDEVEMRKNRISGGTYVLRPENQLMMKILGNNPTPSNQVASTSGQRNEAPSNEVPSKPARFIKELSGCKQVESRMEASIIDAKADVAVNRNILQDHTEIQQALMQQATKALGVCRSKPEFITSRERVESERALLLASLRCQNYLQESLRLQLKKTAPSLPDYGILGEIELKSFKLQLRRSKHEARDSVPAVWFVIVINEGQRYWATGSQCCEDEQQWLCFPEHLVIGGLRPDFKLTLRVYSLHFRQLLNFDDRERYHLPPTAGEQSRSSGWPSPNELLRNGLLRHSRRLAMQRAVQDCSAALGRGSSFRECGELEITSQSLRNSLPWFLCKVPTSSRLTGTISVQSQCIDLEVVMSHDGFVDYGRGLLDGGIFWKTLYCVLDNCELFLWNDPYECCKGFSPKVSIDLRRIVTQTVHDASEELCMRKRTIVISEGRDRTPKDVSARHLRICKDTRYVVVHHLISCSNKDEFTYWKKRLNRVVSTLYDRSNASKYI